MIEWGGCPRKRRARSVHARGPLLTPDFPDILAVPHWSAAAWGAVAAITAIIGTGIAAYSAYQQGQQQAAVFDYNALVARQQADYQRQLASVEAAALERQAMGETAAAEQSVALARLQTEAQIGAAEDAGRIREEQIRRTYDKTNSQVRAAVGASGVTFEGSPLLVLLKNADTAGEELAINDYRTALDVAGANADLSVQASGAMTSATLRAQNLQTEATLRRFGGSIGAQGYLNQANLFGMQAGGARSAGMTNAGTILLGGFGNAAMPFLRYGSTGAGTAGTTSTGFPGYGYGTA